MLKPLRDYILIEPLEQPLSDVIYSPDSHIKKGKIIACGPGKADKKGRIQPLEVKPGQVVRTGDDQWLKFPEFIEGNKRYLMIQEADIVGIE